MAEVAVYTAYVIVGDSAGKLGRVDLRVDATDGKAFVAAADTAARSASKVGLLLSAVSNLTLDNPNAIKARGVDSQFVNDAFAYPALSLDAYISNKLNVSYQTTLGGLPRQNQFTIPMRDPAEYELESNGINVVLEDGADIEDLVTQIADTMLSLYGTACVVSEITVNDQ